MQNLLSRVLRISSPHAKASKVASARPEIYVPAHCFRAGTVVTRDIEGLPGEGRLTFAINCPYENDRAMGIWQYRVTRDGFVVALWDGAQPTGPVKIHLEGVSKDTHIQVQIRVRKDRLNIPSWERASRATIEGMSFHIGSGLVERSHLMAPEDAAGPLVRRFETPTCDLSNLRAVNTAHLPLDVPTRLDVLTPHCTIPLLIVRRPATSRTLVLANGAVDLERSRAAPVFQRSTWWRSFSAHQIYVCDPGTIGENALSLSWCQINRFYWAVPDISLAVNHLAGIMDSPSPESRLYFGSSAGGFIAGSLAILDDGSSALINNAQFDWTRWMAGAVNALRSARFGNRTPAEIRAEHPTRTNLFNLAKSQGSRANIDYLVNLTSPHDVKVDLAMAQQFLREHPASPMRLTIHSYSDPEAGHNPLGQADLIPKIEERLSRLQ